MSRCGIKQRYIALYKIDFILPIWHDLICHIYGGNNVFHVLHFIGFHGSHLNIAMMIKISRDLFEQLMVNRWIITKRHIQICGNSRNVMLPHEPFFLLVIKYHVSLNAFWYTAQSRNNVSFSDWLSSASWLSFLMCA